MVQWWPTVRSLRQYRLFLTLLVVPVLVIVLVVAVVVAISGSGDEANSVASSTGADRQPAPATNTTTNSSAPAIKPVVTFKVPPTQTPVPEPTPAVTSAPKTEATPTAAPIPTSTPKPEGPVEYAVKATDTLFTIAVQFGVSVADLVEFNDLPDENFIFVGQVLEVPTDPAQIIERRESKPRPTTGVVIPAEGLNIRDEPNTETSVIEYVAGGGTELALTGVSKEIDGVKWWEVEDGNWTQGQYLELGVRAAPTPAATETATPTETPAATDGEATPTPTVATTATGTAPPVTVASPIAATIVPESGLNVRKTASQTGDVAYVAATNTAIELSGETANVDGVIWWQLIDGNWVQGQFLKFG